MDLQLRGRRVNLLCQSKFGAHYLLFYIVKYRKMTDVDENLKMFCSNLSVSYLAIKEPKQGNLNEFAFHMDSTVVQWLDPTSASQWGLFGPCLFPPGTLTSSHHHVSGVR